MIERHEIRLCGFGGQGVVLAGYITGQAAAIYDDKYVSFIQDYGPAARGGVCRADVVVSNERVLYPYISAPTVFVALFQESFDKYCPENHKDALVIIDSDLVKPKNTRGKRLLGVPATRMAEELGRVNVANIVMLGFMAAVTDIISVEAMRKSILDSVPKGTEVLNTKAFEKGYAYGREMIGPGQAKKD
ncbi:MAG: 2-oxoacid:acceptor oxidoreductase family protein [Chloroflexota bacterium]